jgi:hypothetical protein
MSVSEPKTPKDKTAKHAQVNASESPDEGDEPNSADKPEKGHGSDDPQNEDSTEGSPDGVHPDNHGAAVSTAAHCDLPGSAHGELVSSIAHDKEATVADAQAACAAAQAAAAAAPTSDESADGHGQGKPEKPEKVKPSHDQGGGQAETDDEVEAVEGSDDLGGVEVDTGNGNGHEKDKGGKG